MAEADAERTETSDQGRLRQRYMRLPATAPSRNDHDVPGVSEFRGIRWRVGQPKRKGTGMTTLPAVRSVADLDLPPLEDWYAAVEAVAGSLTEGDAVAFANEVFEALWTAKSTGDLRALQQVVGAWYATFAFIRQSGGLEGIARLRDESRREHPMTFDEVKARLGI